LTGAAAGDETAVDATESATHDDVDDDDDGDV